MPPKSKQAAPASGAAAKGTAPSTNGTTTPVSTADKKDTSEAPTVGRPDKKVFDAEQDKIKASIDALQVKLARILLPVPCNRWLTRRR
jgi:hypothetical protein